MSDTNSTATPEQLTIEARVSARTSVMERAALFLDSSALAVAKTLPNLEVQRLCIRQHSDIANLDSKAPVYITTAFGLLRPPTPQQNSTHADQTDGRVVGRGPECEEHRDADIDKRIADAMRADDRAHLNAQPGGWTRDGRNAPIGSLHG